MGAFGTVSMMLTYSSEIAAAAAFNGPMDANQCFYASTCHLECGIDAILCELLWTTVNVALNPYILVQNGKQVDTSGYYEPVAFGISAELFDIPDGASARAKCFFSSTDSNFKTTIYTGTSGRLYNYDDETVQDGIAGNFFMDRPGTACAKAWDCADLKTVTPTWSENGDTYFWLNPIYFTIATANFAPSHNPVTGDPVDASPYILFGETSYWHSFFNALPLMRLTTHKESLGSTTNVIYLLLGCDDNDPFGLYAIMDEFARVVAEADAELTINGAYLYESGQAHGHNFSESDLKLALQWFSEALTNGASVDGKTGNLVWSTSVRQSCWIRPDEATIVVSGGIVKYPGDSLPKGTSACASYVGSWWPGESAVHVVDSAISQILAHKATEQKAFFDSKANDPAFQAVITAAVTEKNSYLANF